MYPECTLVIDRIGCLHAWKGRFNYSDDMPESPFFAQGDDVQYCTEHLTTDERETLDEGWHLITTNFPDEYFAIAE